MTNAIFKIILGYGADKVGKLNMLVTCSLLSAISIFALWFIPTPGTFVSFVVLFGVFSGVIISLLPASLMDLFGPQHYHSTSGFMYFVRGVGSLLGSPIAGLFINSRSNNVLQTSDYRGTIIYNGLTLLVGALCFTVLRLKISLVGTDHMGRKGFKV